ncbi:MAG: hypothetical protein ACXWQE_04070 [Bdellovibrionales bacterium]
MMIATVLLAAGITGCKDKPVDTSSPDTTVPGTTPPVTPPVSAAAPFALKMWSKYDDTNYVNGLKFTETGTDTCTATTANPVVTCTVAVEEGRLYFSELNLNFSWLMGQCKLLTFSPYFYKASTSAVYLPPSATATVDCTANPIPPACFGGAAPELVPQFPNFTGLIYFPDESTPFVPLFKTVKITSGYSHGSNSNRHVVNDLPAAKVGNTYTAAQLETGAPFNAGDGYIGGTYRNYKFACRDDFYDPETYIINLFVTDIDSATGNTPEDDFYTWKEAP